MAQVQVSKLTGEALEYACAKADGINVGFITKAELIERAIGDVEEERAIWEKIYADKNADACAVAEDGYKSSMEGQVQIRYGIRTKYDAYGTHLSVIMAREKIGVVPVVSPEGWMATANNYEVSPIEAETLPIAVCRAFVAGKLGDVVEVPDELLA